VLQFGWKVLRYVKVQLPSSPLVEVDLVSASQHYKEIVAGVKVEA
jgi:hypothetical protein